MEYLSDTESEFRKVFSLRVVLILVLMEYSLTVVEILFNCDMTVLILVLMEYSLTL